MDYETAKKLRDAGFPQDKCSCFMTSDDYIPLTEELKEGGIIKISEGNLIGAPTTDELIAELGEELTKIKRYKDGWLAWNRTTGYHGKTVQESLVKMYIELHSKE